MAVRFEPDGGKGVRFEPDGKTAPESATWGAEVSHSLARGSFKAAASVPGTAAAGLELSPILNLGHILPRWTPLGAIARAVEQPKQTAVRQLRRTAKDVYQAASAPSIQPKKGGVGGFIVNAVGETAVQYGLSVPAGMAMGPAGSFAVGAMTMGEDAAQRAQAKGASRTTEHTERLIVGLIGGAIERMQVDEVLKLGKGSVGAIVKAARDRAWKKMGVEAGKLTGEQLMGMASEALEETLQEATAIGAATLHGEKIATLDNAKRLGGAALGGAVVGGVLKGGRTLLGGGGQPADADAALTPIERDEIQQRAEEILAEPEPGAREQAPQPAQLLQTVVPEQPLVAEESAQPAEPAQPAEYRMSARQADVASGREQRGLEPLAPQDSIPWAESARQAQEQGIKDQALAIATTVNAEPRALTHVQTAGMVDKAIELDNQYEQLVSRMAIANASGDATSIKTLSTAIGQNQADYDTLTRAINTSGSEKGRDLASQKLTKGRDFRLVSVVAKATANKGAPLTPQEQAALTEDVKKLEEVTKAAEPLERAAAEEAAADTIGLPKDKSSKKPARKPKRRSGLRRYLSMTEAEKDAELQERLGRDMDAKNITAIADNLASRPGVDNFEDVAKRMTELIPGMERSTIVDAINEATRRKARVTDATVKWLHEIARRQPLANSRIRTTIADVLYYLNTGEVPEVDRQAGRGETWDVNIKMAEIRDMLRGELRNSEPAVKQRLAEQIAYLDARLANGDLEPRPRASVKHTPELDRMRYEVARRRHQIRQRMANLRPKTPWDRVMVPFRLIQAVKSAYDFSAVRRQGGWMVLTHPVRSLRRLPDMFKAFASDADAFKIMEDIHNRPNAPRYAAAGMEFTDPSAVTLTDREEMFRSDFANRIPGIAASNRAYAVFLNLVRADSFDAMSDAFIKDGGVGTEAEEQAIANFINITTGRGATGNMKAAADAMNGLFWSPRYVLSRFQLVFGQPLYRGTWRTRKMIAKEYARYLAGLVVVYTLGLVAGGKLEDDPRSSDFGKIKFGNTRLDPLSGLAQTVTFATRVTTGQTKRASGAVVDIRGKGVPYGGDNTADVAWRFLRTKLAPAPAMMLDVAAGENVVGEPTTAWGLAKGAVVPLSMSDIYDTLKEQGVPAGMALSILGIFGEGVQTYRPKAKPVEARSRSSRRAIRRRAY